MLTLPAPPPPPPACVPVRVASRSHETRSSSSVETSPSMVVYTGNVGDASPRGGAARAPAKGSSVDGLLRSSSASTRRFEVKDRRAIGRLPKGPGSAGRPHPRSGVPYGPGQGRHLQQLAEPRRVSQK